MVASRARRSAFEKAGQLEAGLVVSLLLANQARYWHDDWCRRKGGLASARGSDLR